MTIDTVSPFEFPAVNRKKITSAFDGGRISSDGGVMLLAGIERRLGIADRLAALVPDRRDPTRVTHRLADMIRARLFAICCRYDDCNDFDRLRSDPAFKLACGYLPDSDVDLASQPTLSRLENAPKLRDAIRLTYALVDQWMASYPNPPQSVTLDIDDTCDVVHGRQQLSLFNAHYDEYCFLPNACLRCRHRASGCHGAQAGQDAGWRRGLRSYPSFVSPDPDQMAQHP